MAWLSVWSEVQTCICSSWCHCHSLSLASVKSRLVLPFWYRLTWVVPEKGPLNGCVCVSSLFLSQVICIWLPIKTSLKISLHQNYSIASMYELLNVGSMGKCFTVRHILCIFCSSVTENSSVEPSDAVTRLTVLIYCYCFPASVLKMLLDINIFLLLLCIKCEFKMNRG